MNLLQAAALDRLWARYERQFGEPPPIPTATIDEALDFLRRALAGRTPPGRERGGPGTPSPLAA